MTEQRISPVLPPFDEQVENSFKVVMPPGVPPLTLFTTMANNPRVLSRFINGGLLDKGSISIAQRELVILRTCAMCGAEYEWGVHVAGFAEKAALSKPQIADTCADYVSPDIWTGEQLALIALVDELHRESQISERLWLVLKQHFDEAQLIEFIMLTGLYHAVSFMVNGLRIENESFAPRFPQ